MLFWIKLKIGGMFVGGVLTNHFNKFSGANGQTAYIAKDLGENPLNIPESVARAPNTQIKIEGDVVVITPKVLSGIGDTLSPTDQLNAFSAMSSVMGATGLLDERNGMGTLLNINLEQFKGFNFNQIDGNIEIDNGNGFVYVSPTLADTELPSGMIKAFDGDANNILLQEFSGVDYKHLNIPQDYKGAFQTYVLAHEISHLSDGIKAEDMPNVYQRMRSEIHADNHTLNTYFNEGFKEFVLDLRAMNSLNNTARNGIDESYAMHIWSEEFKEGRALIDSEAKNISEAPQLLDERLNDELDDRGLSKITDPAELYAAYKVMREQGKFDDIPYGNEYVDKYLAANERLVKPEILQPALSKIRNNFAKSEPQNIEAETSDPLKNYDPIEAEGNSPSTPSAIPAVASPAPTQVRPAPQTVTPTI
jgi:hypothetical protein